MEAWGIEWLILILWLAFIVISFWRDHQFLKITTSVIGLFYGLMMLGEVVSIGFIIIIISLGMLYNAIFQK